MNQFFEVVNRIKRERGLDVKSAWDQAEKENPSLASELIESGSGPRRIPNRISVPSNQSASNPILANGRMSEFMGIVNRIKRERGLDVKSAWDQAEKENPSLAAELSEVNGESARIPNRTSDPSRSTGSNPVITNGRMIQFMGLVNRIVQERSLDIRSAWRQAEMENPHLVSDLVGTPSGQSIGDAQSKIMNRAFTPDSSGWIEVLRLGEYPHDSGVIQVIDEEALQTILRNFQLDSSKPNFPGLLVDFEHWSYSTEHSSEAAAWIFELKIDEGVLLAKPDWTEEGQQSIDSGRYRLLSPVFSRQDLQKIGENRVRPTRLDSIGLTNSPNMKGLKPMSS